MELTVPSFGESIGEALISEWLVDEGDRVAVDENLVVVETDKITTELPAPVNCVLKRILKPAGETVAVGDVIAELEELAAGETVAARPDRPAAEAAPELTPAPAAEAAVAERGEVRVMPAARRLAEEAGLDPASVPGSGPGGRVLKEDVQRRLNEGPAPASSAATASPTGTALPPGAERGEERVRMTPLRKKVAAHLLEAQQSAALLTTFQEVDMSAVIALRESQRERFMERHGVKLGFMSFFVKAAVSALAEFPAVNARIEGDEFVYHRHFDIGVAVGGGKGLVVPVIRNAERLSYAEVEKAIGDYAARARDNKLELAELQGGTFTISNGGIYGNLLSTPIVNAPQSGILGLHAIQDRPVAIDGEVVIRPMMYIALTYDHRIIDGREAVTFLRRIKSGVEEPTRILLEV